MSEQVNSQSAQVQVTVPLEKFTDQSHKVLDLAKEEARSFNHNYIGTEHLLLGLLREDESIAATVLRNLGIEITLVRRAVERMVGQGEEVVVGEINLTPRAVTVTAMAVSEAFRLRQDKVGPEHLLLALAREGEGLAAGIMETFGATLEKVRAQTYQAITLTPAAMVTASIPKSNVVTCRIGGRDLDAVDALIEAGIRSTRSDAAAWLIHAGIEANKELLEKVYGTVAEIRRLRVVAQALAQEVTDREVNSSGSIEGPTKQEK